MICPVCGKRFSFFQKGVYCSPECAEAAEKKLAELLERMKQEEDDCGQEDAAERNE